MRLSACLFLIALAGVVCGASLVGVWCVGLAVIADSVTVGVYALLRDDGRNSPRPVSGVTEEQRFIAAVVDDKRRSA